MDIQKVLVANRGEIAIRIFRACTEINLRTVAIYTYEDRYSQHRYKADESYQIGAQDDPLKPYLNMDAIIKLARQKGVDAIHPGYGFLSENAEFAEKCAANGIVFIGPRPEVMRALGDKVRAKEVAQQVGVPIIASNIEPLTSAEVALEEAGRIGYPVMLKAASGGGGRGMRVLRSDEELEKAFPEARREAKTAFGDDTVFIEKFIDNPKHIEVQIMADNHGNLVHLFERDCSVQRRYQKVVEVAPAPALAADVKNRLYQHALAIARQVNYNNVGTVEFLVDQAGDIFFIEVNPRIQVEHTVTEMVTGVDIVKSQVFIAGGYRLSDQQIKVPSQEALHVTGVAMQCRITTEDPRNDFQPDYGTIVTYRSGAGFGIRLDAGSLYQGMNISPFFDSLLVKVSAQGRTLDGAIRKMRRTLQEFRIRGVKTNIPFLLNVISHPVFREGKATVNFIKEHPELFQFKLTQDRATKIVRFLGDVVVNGNPDVSQVDPTKRLEEPRVPEFDPFSPYPKGTKDLLSELGTEKFSEWLKKEQRIHYTDTTLRDAHQSLLATRMRTFDMLKVAEGFAKDHPEVFSMEVWGGATFDVCLRYLSENPWQRLRELRKAVPNILLQMLLRGSNAVGYTAYPDNLIQKFVEESWSNGVDLFRIFDSLNWLPAMKPSIRYVRERTGGLAEVCICYTGDIQDPDNTKYTLEYYVDLAKEIEDAGAHILAIKDMAGLLKPYAATELISALKEAVDLPIHLHTHDTSSLQPATYMKAIEAGVDVVDVALGSLSGLTSQPNFNSMAEMMKFHERHNPINQRKLNEYSNYWETVREYYYPFESGLKAGTAEVFEHEIPGGQYSNLRPQAIGLGLGDRFPEIKKAYKEANELFGDVIKVTPSSKVVGDMALFMVSNHLSAQDVLERGDKLSFPDSVQAFFRGDLGQPYGGFPEKLQELVLKGQEPHTERLNEYLEPVDFKHEFPQFVQKYQPGFVRPLEMTDFLSWKLYPKVFEETLKRWKEFGDVSTIPTQHFFFGLKPNEETIVNVAEGKDIIVKLLSIGPANEEGSRTVFFQVNGQNRNVEVVDKSLNVQVVKNEKVDPDNPHHIGAPLQGRLSKVLVEQGEEVKKNQPLFVIEAMKMESTITANDPATVQKVVLNEGTMVMADDLVLKVE